jgi:hypothetical protein
MANAAGVYLDEDLSRAWLGNLAFHDLEISARF